MGDAHRGGEADAGEERDGGWRGGACGELRDGKFDDRQWAARMTVPS